MCVSKGRLGKQIVQALSLRTVTEEQVLVRQSNMARNMSTTDEPTWDLGGTRTSLTKI